MASSDRGTPELLRQLFVDRGGRPQRAAPHYFVLGQSPWFERLAVGMRLIRVLLDALPSELTSATVPDSFTAMGFGDRFGYPADPKPYHGRVYLLDELDDVIAQFGLPSPSWEHNHENWLEWPESAYIEVQLGATNRSGSIWPRPATAPPNAATR